MRKILAVLTASVVAVAATLTLTKPADAYMFTRNGYTFADTSYSGNVAGSYFRTTSRYDATQGYLYVGLTGYDQTCDHLNAAIRIRGWDVQTQRWRYENVLWVTDPCKGSGQGMVSIPVRALGVDAVIVQDGLRGVTFGRNFVRIFYKP